MCRPDQAPKGRSSGIAPKCTTISAPSTRASIAPRSVRSACTKRSLSKSAAGPLAMSVETSSSARSGSSACDASAVDDERPARGRLTAGEWLARGRRAAGARPETFLPVGIPEEAIPPEEKYFLKWKEDITENTEYELDKYLQKICNKKRFIELLYDFVIFDAGIKKLPRAHQYFSIKAAQEHVHRKEGGIIWHTQGSGKSIVMVLLAKWILENNPHARVAVVTDRNQLDKQIEGVYEGSGLEIYRAKSGIDLMSKLGQATPRMLCFLIQKFGKRGVNNFEQFMHNCDNS